MRNHGREQLFVHGDEVVRFREADEAVEGAGLGDDAGEFFDELLPIGRFKELNSNTCK